MKILVYEYVTGGGAARETLPSALVAEADLMVAALVSDLSEITGVEVMFTRDPRLRSLDLPGEWRWDDPVHRPWDIHPQRFDAVWPIAPETGGTLERVSTSIIHANKILLGSRPEAIAVCSSKTATLSRLAEHGLPVVPTYLMQGGTDFESGPWVLKPDDGVGCEETFLCADHDMLVKIWHDLGRPAGYIAQPYVSGEAASLSLLCHADRPRLLCVNRQEIALAGRRLAFRGSQVNALSGHRDSLQSMAERLAAAVPGLWGYVGVDCILSGPTVTLLEVNPRLTTSYAGIKSALGVNPAQLILSLAAGRDIEAEISAHTVAEVRVATSHGY